jgi:hypothetical protein
MRELRGKACSDRGLRSLKPGVPHADILCMDMDHVQTLFQSAHETAKTIVKARGWRDRTNPSLYDRIFYALLANHLDEAETEHDEWDQDD